MISLCSFRPIECSLCSISKIEIYEFSQAMMWTKRNAFSWLLNLSAFSYAVNNNIIIDCIRILSMNQNIRKRRLFARQTICNEPNIWTENKAFMMWHAFGSHFSLSSQFDDENGLWMWVYVLWCHQWKRRKWNVIGKFVFRSALRHRNTKSSLRNVLSLFYIKVQNKKKRMHTHQLRTILSLKSFG